MLEGGSAERVANRLILIFRSPHKRRIRAETAFCNTII